MSKQDLRVGIGCPVGSGKTALALAFCQALREQIEMAVVTNDIYTAEDAKFLVNHSALTPSASSVSKPAVARTRRFARTPRSITRPLTACSGRFRASS